MDIKNAKILVVDDNKELCRMVANICRQNGFDAIRAAYSAREAWELIQKEAWDFLILDVNMPGEDGFAFFKRAKSLLEE